MRRNQLVPLIPTSLISRFDPLIWGCGDKKKFVRIFFLSASKTVGPTGMFLFILGALRLIEITPLHRGIYPTTIGIVFSLGGFIEPIFALSPALNRRWMSL